MKVTRILTVTVVCGVLASCASSGSVDQKIAAAQAETTKKIESVSGQIEDLQQKQKATDAHLATTDQKMAELSQEAQDALKRAQEAGVLSKGKVVFQQTFSEDRVKFKSGSYELDKDAKAALDDFAGKVKALNEQYFVEVQGHTDDVGGRKYNDDLGQRRADEVRRYLSRSGSLPLNRMSTISYGDTLPVAPNKTKKGRAQNRRVVIVVLE
jgi:outer membrane protein OmpA-like peptidoglycan-associated protein